MSQTIRQRPSQPPQKTRDGVPRWRAAIVVLVVLLLLGTAIYKYLRLRPHLSALLVRAELLRTLAAGDTSSLASAGRLVWLRDELGATRRDLEAVRNEIRPALSLVRHLGWLPKIGYELSAAPALLDVAIHLCDAGWWSLLGLEPLADAVSGQAEGTGRTALETVLPPLTTCAPRFAEAEQALEKAQKLLERLPAYRFTPPLARWMARLEGYLPVLQASVMLAQAGPELLGQDHPVTYVVLAQNNHELRATGGFISGVGAIKLSQGRIITTTFQDSYQVDGALDLGSRPPAPTPLRDYMWAPALVLRDANWSPDLPSSAAVVASIYRQSRGSEVDGVVALDLEAVTALLQALGPLQPEGYPAPVTGDSLLQYVQQYWTAPLQATTMDKDETEWWLHRKDFMADLLQAALRRVTTSPQSLQWGKLAWATFDALRSKHLLLTLQDPTAARALRLAGWDGALRPYAGDYLMIVDSNVGFRKVNPNIQQHIAYRVDLSAKDAAIATLTLRYTNRSQGTTKCVAGSAYEGTYEELMQGCYWDYVRVYAPRGSQLLEVAGNDQPPEVSEEAGRAVFGILLALAPGQTHELVFHYSLPAQLAIDPASPAYRLLVQKQPGTLAIPLQVSLVTPQHGPIPLHAQTLSSGADGQALASDAEFVWKEAGAGTRAATLLGSAGLLMLLAGLAVRSRSDRHHITTKGLSARPSSSALNGESGT